MTDVFVKTLSVSRSLRAENEKLEDLERRIRDRLSRSQRRIRKLLDSIFSGSSLSFRVDEVTFHELEYKFHLELREKIFESHEPFLFVLEDLIPLMVPGWEPNEEDRKEANSLDGVLRRASRDLLKQTIILDKLGTELKVLQERLENEILLLAGEFWPGLGASSRYSSTGWIGLDLRIPGQPQIRVEIEPEGDCILDNHMGLRRSSRLTTGDQLMDWLSSIFAEVHLLVFEKGSS